MKISNLILAAAISSMMVSSVAGGGCVTGATSDRDQCLCGCLRSGWDCSDGTDLMPGATDAEFEERCKSNIVAGGPCRWDPNASRTDGSSCTSSCPSTTLCGGGVDPPTTPAPVEKCSGVTCTDGDCPGNCCRKTGGTCSGPKRLRRE